MNIMNYGFSLVAFTGNTTTSARPRMIAANLDLACPMLWHGPKRRCLACTGSRRTDTEA